MAAGASSLAGRLAESIAGSLSSARNGDLRRLMGDPVVLSGVGMAALIAAMIVKRRLTEGEATPPTGLMQEPDEEAPRLDATKARQHTLEMTPREAAHTLHLGTPAASDRHAPFAGSGGSVAPRDPRALGCNAIDGTRGLRPRPSPRKEPVGVATGGALPLGGRPSATRSRNLVVVEEGASGAPPVEPERVGPAMNAALDRGCAITFRFEHAREARSLPTTRAFFKVHVFPTNTVGLPSPPTTPPRGQSRPRLPASTLGQLLDEWLCTPGKYGAAPRHENRPAAECATAASGGRRGSVQGLTRAAHEWSQRCQRPRYEAAVASLEATYGNAAAVLVLRLLKEPDAATLRASRDQARRFGLRSVGERDLVLLWHPSERANDPAVSQAVGQLSTWLEGAGVLSRGVLRERCTVASQARAGQRLAYDAVYDAMFAQPASASGGHWCTQKER